ncbi:MAG: FG-GAP-like repeat-containing protein [Rubripirellula sp.]
MRTRHHALSDGWPLFVLVIVTFCVGCDRSAAPSANAVPEESPAPKTKVRSAQPVPSVSAIRSALASGRTDKALELAKSLLVSKPDHAETLFLVGQCFYLKGNATDAIETLLQIPIEDQNFGVMARGQVADWQMNAGMTRDAETTLQTLLQHQDLTLARSRLALLCNSQGKRIEAVPHLKALAERQDITRRELGALIAIGDQCSTQKVPGTTGTDDNLVRGDLRRARQLAMNGKWEQSLALVRELQKSFPQEAPIAAFYGRVLVTLQRIDDLIDWHQELPADISNQPEYWGTMARWMALQGNHPAAIRCACEALAIESTSILLYDLLAQSLRSQGKLLEAEQASERSRLLGEVKTTFERTFQPGATAEDCVEIGLGVLKLNRPWEALGWRTAALKMDAKCSLIPRLDQAMRQYEPESDLSGWVLCGLDRSEFPLPDRMEDATESGHSDDSLLASELSLQDVADSVGLDFQFERGQKPSGRSHLIHQTMGGGIGVLDFDLDGWPDLYFAQGGNVVFEESDLPDSLYRNLRGERFQDVVGAAGIDTFFYGQGVAAADWNQDGFTDLILAGIGANVLYRNNGDGTFSRQEVPEWDAVDHWTSMVGCADLSGDGLPELVECNYITNAQGDWCSVTDEKCGPAVYSAAHNRVLQLQPSGGFAKWSGGSALEASLSYSLGVMITNVDGIPGNDLYIANDTTENELWSSTENQSASPGGERFRLQEQARVRGCAVGSIGELQGCMGIAVGDFDRNQTFDMYVTNYYNESANLYLQQSIGLFVDCAAMYSARKPSELMVGFGTQAADLDCDGWLDLVVLNGHAIDRRRLGEPLAMLPQVFRGRRGQFEQEMIGDRFWQQPTIGRTLATLDFNRDGRPDFVGNHLDHPASLLQNKTIGGNWAQFKLIGVDSERDAIGAKVTIRCEDQTWVSWVTAGDGYYCTNERVVRFGIGPADRIRSVTVDWPSGKSQQFESLKSNCQHIIIENIDECFRLLPEPS